MKIWYVTFLLLIFCHICRCHSHQTHTFYSRQWVVIIFRLFFTPPIRTHICWLRRAVFWNLCRYKFYSAPIFLKKVMIDFFSISLTIICFAIPSRLTSSDVCMYKHTPKKDQWAIFYLATRVTLMQKPSKRNATYVESFNEPNPRPINSKPHASAAFHIEQTFFTWN
jgi:hypothetical protein